MLKIHFLLYENVYLIKKVEFLTLVKFSEVYKYINKFKINTGLFIRVYVRICSLYVLM